MNQVLTVTTITIGVTASLIAIVYDLAVLKNSMAPPHTPSFADAAPAVVASAVITPPGVDDPAFANVRVILAGLAKNPKAVKPTLVTPAGEEPHTTYEYSIAGVGDVLQWRVDSRRWELFIPQGASTMPFAPPDGVAELDRFKAFRWWRVRTGPFSGSFLFLSPGGIEVRSKESVCSAPQPETLPLVARECST